MSNESNTFDGLGKSITNSFDLTVTNLTVEKDALVKGDLTVLGNTNFGNISITNASVDNLTVNDLLTLNNPLPIVSGGTGLSTVGAVGQVLTSTGTGLQYTTPGTGGGTVIAPFTVQSATNAAQTVVTDIPSGGTATVRTSSSAFGLDIAADGYGSTNNKRIRLLADTVTVSNSSSSAETANYFNVSIPASISSTYCSDFLRFTKANNTSSNSAQGIAMYTFGNSANPRLEMGINSGTAYPLTSSSYFSMADTTGSFDISFGAGNISFSTITGNYSATTLGLGAISFLAAGAGAISINTAGSGTINMGCQGVGALNIFTGVGELSISSGGFLFLSSGGTTLITASALIVAASSTNINGALSVTGLTQLSGNLNVTGLAQLQGNLNVTGSSSFQGNVAFIGSVQGGVASFGNSTLLSLEVLQNALFSGNVSVIGTFSSIGSAAINGALSTNGNFTASGLSTLNGGVIITGALTASGLSTLNGGVVITGALTASGLATLNGGIICNGALTVNGFGTIQGGANIAGGLGIQGGANIIGAVGIQGGVEIAGATNLNGAVGVQGIVNVTGSVAVQGPVSLTGALVVGGLASLNGATNILGLLTCQGSVNMIGTNLTVLVGGVDIAGIYANLTCTTGNIGIASGSGAVKIAADSGGVSVGGNGNGYVANFEVKSRSGIGAFQTGNISFVIDKTASEYGPGNFFINTTAAAIGDMYVSTKGIVAVSSNSSPYAALLNTSSITGSSYSWIYPSTAGSLNSILLSGGGSAAMTWLVPGSAGTFLSSNGTSLSWQSVSASVNWASPGTIGSTTPNTGAFTTLEATGNNTSFSSGVLSVVNTTTSSSAVATFFTPSIFSGNSTVLIIGKGTGNNEAAYLNFAYNTIPSLISSTWGFGNSVPGTFIRLNGNSEITMNGNVSLNGSITLNGQISSTWPTGTAPFTVSSTTVVPNLNVSQLLGSTWNSPGTIGSTTRNTGAFTTLSASASNSVLTSGVLSITNTSTLTGAAATFFTPSIASGNITQLLLGRSNLSNEGTYLSFTYNTTASSISSTWGFANSTPTNSISLLGNGSNLINGPTTINSRLTSTLATGTAPFAITSTTVVPNLNVSQLLGATWVAPGTIGSTTRSTGAFTTLAASGVITSTQATGTAPFAITSTTLVPNLNVSQLVGATWVSPGTIGSTTRNTGAFTTLAASGVITSTQATGTSPFAITSTTLVPNLNVSQLLGATWLSPGTIGSTTRNTGAFTTLEATGNNTSFSSGVLSVVNTTTSSSAAATFFTPSIFSGNSTVLIIGKGTGNNEAAYLNFDYNTTPSLISSTWGFGNAVPANFIRLNGDGTITMNGTVSITGGISYSGQIISSVVTGTAPFSIASTTVVPNLNVSQLLGATWNSPGAIGSTTPNFGAFSSLSTTGQIVSTLASGTAPFTLLSTTVVPNLNVSQLLGSTWEIPGAIGNTTRNTGAFTNLSAFSSSTVFTSGVLNVTNTATVSSSIATFMSPNIASGNATNIILGQGFGDNQAAYFNYSHNVNPVLISSNWGFGNGVPGNSIQLKGDGTIRFFNGAANVILNPATVSGSKTLCLDSGKNVVTRIGGSSSFYGTFGTPVGVANNAWTTIDASEVIRQKGNGLLAREAGGFYKNQSGESLLVTISFSAIRESNAFGYSAVRITLNNSTVLQNQDGAANDRISVSASLYLDPLETVSAQFFQNSGVGLNIVEVKLTINTYPLVE